MTPKTSWSTTACRIVSRVGLDGSPRRDLSFAAVIALLAAGLQSALLQTLLSAKTVRLDITSQTRDKKRVLVALGDFSRPSLDGRTAFRVFLDDSQQQL